MAQIVYKIAQMRRFKIAALIETSQGHNRAILRGIAAYAEAHQGWDFHFDTWGQVDVRVMARHADADGIITRVVNSDYAQALQAMNKPTVIVASAHGLEGMPAVTSDGRAIGQMAADHLMAQGFEHFAFVGSSPVAFSELRGDGMASAIAARGHSFDRFTLLNDGGDIGRLMPWLRDLPKPIGLLAANDGVARRVLLTCNEAHVHVPQSLAIVGVNNDQLFCRLSNPQLSSIDHGALQIGYRAAQILDRMLRGRRPPARPVVVKPVGVIVRGSSDVLAIEDPVVATALRLVRTQAHRTLRVDDIARTVAVGRRSLEISFRQAMGHGVYEEIVRTRLANAQRLLLETALPMPAIAASVGLSHAAHLSALFRVRLGMSPTAYRRLHLSAGPRVTLSNWQLGL